MKQLKMLVFENGCPIENLVITAINTSAELRQRVSFRIHTAEQYSKREHPPEIILVDWENYGETFIFKLAEEFPDAKIWLQHECDCIGPKHPHIYAVMAKVHTTIHKALLDANLLHQMLLIELESTKPKASRKSP